MGVDSAWADSGEASNWIPESSRYPPAEAREVFDFTKISGVPGWTPSGVASQKIGPVASDIPGLAPQHTFPSGKEPYNHSLSL